MKIRQASIYIDQNVPVYDGNKYLTIRLGVGLTAVSNEKDVLADTKALQVMAETLLGNAMGQAKLNAQTRLTQAALHIAEEKELL